MLALNSHDFIKIFRCCWWGLNSRPPPYQGGALPLSYSSVRGQRRAGRYSPRAKAGASRPPGPQGLGPSADRSGVDGEAKRTILYPWRTNGRLPGPLPSLTWFRESSQHDRNARRRHCAPTCASASSRHRRGKAEARSTSCLNRHKSARAICLTDGRAQRAASPGIVGMARSSARTR